MEIKKIKINDMVTAEQNGKPVFATVISIEGETYNIEWEDLVTRALVVVEKQLNEITKIGNNIGIKNKQTNVDK